MSPLTNPFASTSTVTAGPIGKGPTADDVETILNDETKVDTKEEVDETEEVDEKEEKKDEIEIKDDDNLDEDDGKLDLKDDKTDITVPPKVKDIKAEFPEFFKKFPFVEKMLFRDREYTELFGSFDNAKEIASKSEQFNEFESQLLSGKTENILKVVRETDTKAFDKIVDDYLPALHRIDKDAYIEVCGNLIKNVISGMWNEGKKKENQELMDAAIALNEYTFDTKDYTPPKLRVNKGSEDKNTELEDERKAFLNERFTIARDGLQTRVDNALTATIAEYIDPRGLMSAYEKKNAIREALDLTHSTIGSDSVFRTNLDRLWKAAEKDKFSKISVDKIRSAYLGRAKSSLASVIKRVRIEALKDSASRKPVEKDEEEKEETRPQGRNVKTNAGRPSQPTKKANERQKGESIEDFFARD
jgi:hypothetical protein